MEHRARPRHVHRVADPTPRRALAVAASAAVLALAVGLTLWSESSLLGRSAGLTLLVVFAAAACLFTVFGIRQHDND